MDKVSDMKVDKVAIMEVHMVADMEVDKVDKVQNISISIKPEMF